MLQALLHAVAPATMADRERDKRNWAAAAALYRRAVARAGGLRHRFRYLVQLGNCLKEAGRFDEALAAYDDAVRIDDRNADLFVQRGHLHKRMGDTPAAACAYHRAFDLDPANPDARFEIEVCGARAIAGVQPRAGASVINTVWIDVTDFIEYARHNASLSGIQRVCANVLLHAADVRLAGYRVAPVLPDYDSGHVYALRFDGFLDLVKLFGARTVSHTAIIGAVEKLIGTKAPVAPGARDIFFVIGAFWIVPRYDLVARLRRAGTAFGLFVHDLLPLRHPDFALPEAVAQFGAALAEAAALCDFILANSRHTRDDVAAYLHEIGRGDVPVADVLLPTALGAGQATRDATDPDDPRLTSILSQDYVLVVSTIEIRKNHALLIRVWEALRAELNGAMPRLVFVGKWGWHVDALRAQIAAGGYDGDWLFVLNTVSDAELDTLYRRALFTVYPSFAEGFGLPIGESLARGTPCIASGTTAMPEVGGDVVRYFDPFDRTTALAQIRKVIVDRDALARWRQQIATDFTPRTWEDFGDRFYQAILAGGHVDDRAQPLAEGSEFFVGRATPSGHGRSSAKPVE